MQRVLASGCAGALALLSGCDVERAGDGSPHEEAAQLAQVGPVSAAPGACRAVRRATLTHASIERVLGAGGHESLTDGRAFRTGGAITLLPTSQRSSPTGFVRLAPDGTVTGAALPGIDPRFAGYGTVGRAGPEQIVQIRTGGSSTFAAVLDLATARLLDPRPLFDARVNGAAATVGVAPALDGRHSVYFAGNVVTGPMLAGVVGADAQPAGPATLLTREDARCLQIFPTEHAGALSFLEETPDRRRFRVVTLDEAGSVAADAHADGLPEVPGCPLVSPSASGFAALWVGPGAARLVRLGRPDAAMTIAGLAADGVRGLAMVGDEPWVFDRDGVVRVRDGVVDEASRLHLSDGTFAGVLARGEAGFTVQYHGPTTHEIVDVDCR